MSPLHKNIANLLFLIPSYLLLSACASIPPQNSGYVSNTRISETDHAPKSVIIMPFDNDTTEKGIEILARKSFYNHFSSKNYRDFELDETDHGLEMLTKGSPASWRDLSPSRVGKFFHADYVIYGRVRSYKKIFLGIYSQISLGLELEMIDCSNGDLLFGKTVIQRSHDGGLPFSLFGIIPAALRSGLHMKEERTIELVDRVNRELVELIPEPPAVPVIPYFVEIQIASFLENERAQQTLKEFEGEGLNPRIEIINLDGKIWNRVILGPYYNLPEAERIRDRIARNTGFRPIFIHHYPEATTSTDQEEGTH